MVERKTFLDKPKHHCHLSRWRECVYFAQSRVKRRLLHVSKFVSIDERTLILWKWWKEERFLWTKAAMSFITIRRKYYDAQSWKEKTLCVYMFIPINEWTLILRKMFGRKVFLLMLMCRCYLSQWGEYVYSANHVKEGD